MGACVALVACAAVVVLTKPWRSALEAVSDDYPWVNDKFRPTYNRDEECDSLVEQLRDMELQSDVKSPFAHRDLALGMMRIRMSYEETAAWERSLSPAQASQFRSWTDEIGRKTGALRDRGE